MIDTPKRIWIERNPISGIPPFPSWNDDEAHESLLQTAEYTRADIVEELAAALELAHQYGKTGGGSLTITEMLKVDEKIVAALTKYRMHNP